MGMDLRPVIEKWGPSYRYLLGHEEMTDLLGEIADRAGIEHQSADYADLKRVWIADGTKFLDFLAGGREAMLRAKAQGRDFYDLSDHEIEVVDELAGMVEQWRAWVDLDDGASRI